MVPEAVREILLEYKQILEKNIESNNESIKSYHLTCDSIIESCQQILNKDGLTFEEKKEILMYMVKVFRNERIKRYKKIIFVVCIAIITTVGGGLAILVSALGVNAMTDRPSIK